jgi:hypothetical protein
MAHLVVLGLDNLDDAERVFELSGDLARQQLLELQDAACAWRDDMGEIHIQQSISLTGAGASSGALWGTLNRADLLDAGRRAGHRGRHRGSGREAGRRRHQRQRHQTGRLPARAGQGGGVPAGPVGHGRQGDRAEGLAR